MKKQRLFYSFALFVAFTLLIAWQFAAKELNERDLQPNNVVNEIASSEAE